MTDLPAMTVDEYLKILRSSTATEHNPFTGDPTAPHLAPAFAVLASAVADFVDACRLDLTGDGYAEAVSLLGDLVGAFPTPESIQEGDLTTLLAPLYSKETS